MQSLNIKKIVGIFTLGGAIMLGTGAVANAQDRNWNRDRDYRSAREQRIRLEQQRRAELERQRIERLRYQTGRYNNNYGYGNNGYNTTYGQRYRVMRNGQYYTTDSRGAEVLRQAVNQGYQQGFQAGQNDRNGRRSGGYYSSNIYRSGTYGYSNGVDRSQYQYYFQQGFQKGYDDGYNSRNRYGTYNNGGASILGSILGTILNLQSY